MLGVSAWNPIGALIVSPTLIPNVPGTGSVDVRAEAAQQLRALGIAPTYLSRAEKDGVKAGNWPRDDAGAKKFVLAWSTYLAEESVAVDYEFGVTNFWLTMGVADCDTLTRYNNRALSNYLRLYEVYDTMVKGGVTGLGVPPFPRLFGSVKESFTPTGSNISVDLPRCQAGYPVEPVMVNAPRIPPGCEVPTDGLAIVWLAPVIYIAGAAIVLAITGYAAYQIIEKLGSSQKNQIIDGMDKRRYEQDAKRADYAQKCFLKSITPGMSIDEQRRRREGCSNEAMGIFPDRDASTGDLETGSFFGQIGKAALYVGIGAALLFGGLAIYKAFSK